jgi:hypothetical protein
LPSLRFGLPGDEDGWARLDDALSRRVAFAKEA